MRLLQFITFVVFILMIACQSEKKTNSDENISENKSSSEINKIIVDKIIQTTNYTYIRAKKDGNDTWMAAPKTQAEQGQSYYYKDGIEMKNFKSKELDKTFESIIFIDVLSSDSKMENTTNTTNENIETIETMAEHSSKLTPEKKEISIKPVKGCITIADLYGNKANYKGKTVKVKGEVAKFNAAIMNRNWIHIQDGTNSNGKFDLTVTSDLEAKVGDVIIVEGKVVVDKDFGYNYKYEVLIEKAKLINQ